jgi:hypothetical protein
LAKAFDLGGTDLRICLYAAALFTPVFLGGCDSKSPLERKADHLQELNRTSPNATPQTWAQVGTLECRPNKKNVCGVAGCRSSEPRTFLRLKPSDGTYQRCDSQGCDTYKAAVSYSGIWTNMTVADRALLARLTSGLQFVEVTTMNDDFYLYRGTCKPTH